MKKRNVLVISRSSLFNILEEFQGYKQLPFTMNFDQRLQNDAIWLDKAEAEENPEYKQLIGYTVVVNSGNGHIFAYQREMNNNYKETRLQGMWSWGIGGHIEENDIGAKSIIYASVDREIREELDIENFYTPPKLIGCINDDSNAVGRVHFGLVFTTYTVIADLGLKGQENKTGSFLPINKIVEIALNREIENWSRIILPYIIKSTEI